MMIQDIKAELQEAATLLEQFLTDEDQLKTIQEAADVIVESLKSGGTIFSCGNGGSSCDAAHFAEEMTGRFREDREPFSAIAITDHGHISCVANDFGYDKVFSRFIRGLGKKGDVLLAISTSGNSPNVLNAAELARQKEMKVVSLSGKTGGKLAEFSDAIVKVPFEGYADRIQEIHIKVIHILILLIEKAIN